MNKKFFIIIPIETSNGDIRIHPIIDEDENIILYESEKEAVEAMTGHMSAEAFGYEIFELGTGTIK